MKLNLVVLFFLLIGICAVSSPVRAQSCTLKASGDADCNGDVDIVDFEIWRKEFSRALDTNTADFNGDAVPDLIDFEIWRRSYITSLTPTVTEGASPTATVAPTVGATVTPPTTPPADSFPTKTSTGVPAGVSLTQHTGSYTLSSGTYEGVHFTQPVYLSPGSPIVFRNCRFTGGEGQFGSQVTLMVNRGDVTFDRSDFDGGTGHVRSIVVLRDYDRGDVSSNLTVTNSRFLRYGAAAVESSSDNVLVEGNYMEEIEELHGTHADGVQIEAGNGVTIRNNTILLNTDITGEPDSDTAPIAVMAELGNVSNVVTENNFIAGGAFAVYYEVKGYPWTGDAIFRNNRISTQFYPQGGRYGALYPNSRPSQLVFTGNVFHESGTAVNP